jgi:hypothetical protein
MFVLMSANIAYERAVTQDDFDAVVLHYVTQRVYHSTSSHRHTSHHECLSLSLSGLKYFDSYKNLCLNK